jgi:formamidopyrimidine-DNA glycosylase
MAAPIAIAAYGEMGSEPVIAAMPVAASTATTPAMADTTARKARILTDMKRAAPRASARTSPRIIHWQLHMPELPDVELYVSALRPRIVGKPLQRLRIGNPFIVRTIDPPPLSLEGRRITDVRRMGKRIVFCLDDDLFVLLHLMIAGRLRWRDLGAAIPGKVGLAAFDFPDGTIVLTEAGARRQAAIHIVRGEAAVAEHDPGGLEVFAADLAAFAGRLTRENHTLKRALTDPHILSGIGNAYSDEILHAARLSPMKLTSTLTDEEMQRLFSATRRTLEHWVARLQEDAGGEFPEKVTAFHDGMAVHGRYGQPCPVCGAPVQRIVHSRNESNYCAMCQTGGRLLSDRALARLLREDWPRTLEELERKRR